MLNNKQLVTGTLAFHWLLNLASCLKIAHSLSITTNKNVSVTSTKTFFFKKENKLKQNNGELISALTRGFTKLIKLKGWVN